MKANIKDVSLHTCNISHVLKLTCVLLREKYPLFMLLCSVQLNSSSENILLFRTKVYKLAVSTYQMGVLLLFNNTTELTKREIQDATLLLDNPFKVAVLGLLKNKVVETENEDAKTWDDSTKFTINTKLASKKMKINCNVPVMVDNVKDGGGAQSDVSKQEIEQDRVFKLRVCFPFLSFFFLPLSFHIFKVYGNNTFM